MHEHGCVLKGGLLHAGTVAFNDGGGEDGDDVLGELGDVPEKGVRRVCACVCVSVCVCCVLLYVVVLFCVLRVSVCCCFVLCVACSWCFALRVRTCTLPFQ